MIYTDFYFGLPSLSFTWKSEKKVRALPLVALKISFFNLGFSSASIVPAT